jgi:hypothetical protein
MDQFLDRRSAGDAVARREINKDLHDASMHWME